MIVELLMPLKERLRELRKAADLTQQDLAVKSGLTLSAVVQLESGKIKDPRMTTLLALARALNVTLDELVSQEDGGPEEPKKPTPKKPKK
jgi:putative transcriptional regulator